MLLKKRDFGSQFAKKNVFLIKIECTKKCYREGRRGGVMKIVILFCCILTPLSNSLGISSVFWCITHWGSTNVFSRVILLRTMVLIKMSVCYPEGGVINMYYCFVIKSFNCCYYSEGVVVLIQKRVFESHFSKKRGSYKK